MAAELTDLDFSVRVGLLVVANVLLFGWTRYVVAPAEAGRPRVLRAAPLLPVVIFITFLFRIDRPQEYLLALNSATFYMWLLPCKVWSLAMNRGQLVKSYDAGSTAAFALGLLGPIVVAFEEKPVAENKDHKLIQKGSAYTDAQFSVVRFKGKAFFIEAIQIISCLAAKVVLAYVMRGGYYWFEDSDLFFFRDFCLGWIIYAVSSFVEGLYAFVVLMTLNMKIATSFDCPFLAQSMQELWSRRYNLVAGESLRDIVYDPICEGCWRRGSVYRRKEWPSATRKAVGTFVTFMASGALHCYMLKYIAPESDPILIGLFFVACCFLVLAESTVRSLLKSSGHLKYVSEIVPAWMRVGYTLSALFYFAHVFFWPEVHKAGLSAGLVNGLFPS